MRRTAVGQRIDHYEEADLRLGFVDFFEILSV